jgi:mannose-6-phosphate isomerase-like protein (cupin superfamily)
MRMMETRIATGKQPLVRDLDDFRHGAAEGPHESEVAQTPHHRVNLWTVLEGQSIPAHRHTNSECIMVVMDGEGEYRHGDRAVALGKYMMTAVPPGAPHAIRNTGTAPLVVLTIEGPGWFDAREMEEGGGKRHR